MTDDQAQGGVANPAGLPEMHPPVGGPNADPDSPDPGQFVPGRPGVPEAAAEDADDDGLGAGELGTA